MTIKLGQRVRDRLTGLEGTVISRTEFLYGCVRVGIQPLEVKDGKPVDSSWVDEPQCDVIDDTPAKMAEPRHGPRPDATRAPDHAGARA